jgi:hypothetical protein
LKITILDGALDSSPRFWSNYMRELVGVLEENGSTVAHIPLKDRIIDHCTGCFKCWVQAPGVCIITDDSQAVNRKIINSDFVLWASPMVMGFASFMLKKTIDRMIPLVHPYLVFEGGEIHHLARYKKYPLFGLLLQPEKHDCVENIVVTQRIFARTARNIKSRLAFAFTTDAPASETAQRIINAENERFHSPPISAINR